MDNLKSGFDYNDINSIKEHFGDNVEIKKFVNNVRSAINELGLEKFESLVIAKISNTSAGMVYITLGKHIDAINWFKKAIDEGNHNESTFLNISIAYHFLGRNHISIEYLEKGASLYPESYSIYNGLGYIYEKMGDRTKACIYYHRALEKAFEQLGGVPTEIALSIANNCG